MPPAIPFEYRIAPQRSGQRVRQLALRFRRSMVAFFIAIIALYVFFYGAIRQSHTKFWFDKGTDQSVPYTLFDAYSRVELFLYVVFRPACALDHAITGRTFVYDKW
jgi:hypothetical protein